MSNFLVQAGTMTQGTPRRIRVRKFFSNKEDALKAAHEMTIQNTVDFWELSVKKNGDWISAYVHSNVSLNYNGK
jgi:hypothetical protein